MNFLILLFFTSASAMFDFDCGLMELPDISSDHTEEVYVVRNHPSNKEWNKEFTLENMDKHVHSNIIPHMKPLNAPDDFKTMRFSTFLEKHILKYDDQSLEEILMNDYEDRMLFPFVNHSHTIFPSLTDGHSCEHMEQYAVKVNKDYFIGAKGSGVNFHQHHEIFNQLVSGKKLWLILDDYTTLNGVHGPRDIISPKIMELVELDGIKLCIMEPGDIIHLPADTIHATFNIETSISTACIASQDKNVLYPKHELKDLIEESIGIEIIQ